MLYLILIKRIFDIILSGTLFILLIPLLGIIALLIRCFLGSPVLFHQLRPGLHGKIFQMIKFRTMRDIKDVTGELLPDSERLSRLGNFLRATSLDELPELWNVIKGDMSLVGPRPLLIEYLPLYNEQQRRRHEVKPGITGLAQISGRNALTWHEKFALDIWYIDNHNFWLDCKILFLTIKKVIMREGIASNGSLTTEKFTGNAK